MTLTYFEPVKRQGDTELGRIGSITGTLLTIDPINRAVLLTSGRVEIGDILDVGIR